MQEQDLLRCLFLHSLRVTGALVTLARSVAMSLAHHGVMRGASTLARSLARLGVTLDAWLTPGRGAPRAASEQCECRVGCIAVSRV